MSKRLTRGEAIKKFCVDCMGGSIKMPAKCDVYHCSLWPYRTGREQKIPSSK